MFFTALLFVSCSVGTLAQSPYYYDPEHANIYFTDFLIKYNKTYASGLEMFYRFQIFKENLEDVNKLNEDTYGAVFGITYFMDLTKEEFVKKYTGLRSSEDDVFCPTQSDIDIVDVETPFHFDWRKRNAVTRVKDQGQCGSCWAFSAAGVLEGQYAIRNQKPVELSEQQIIDCDLRSDGCCGGWVATGIKSVIQQGGIMEENQYQYKEDKRRCVTNETAFVAKVDTCFSWSIDSQEKIKQLLYSYGPISIAIKSTALHKYKEGILTDHDCDVGVVNHAVLLVGYGEENGQEYWIVKNSWGPYFGERGYFRMERGEHSSSCGMQNTPMTTATLE